MKNELEMIKEFRSKFGFPHGRSITTSSVKNDRVINFIGKYLQIVSKQIEDRAVLRMTKEDDPMLYRLHLLLEETGELMEACFINDEVMIFDAIVDLMYVLIGFADTYGLPIEEGFAEVHKSNMTKRKASKDTRLRNKGGKYVAPDLLSILKERNCHGNC